VVHSLLLKLDIVLLMSAHLLGHGGSDGLHGYVHSLDHAVSDLVCR
jgi:hypothetical protein